MNISLGQYFALLIAFNKAERCDSLKAIVRNELFGDRCHLFYFGKLENPDSYKTLRKEFAKEIKPLFEDLYPIYRKGKEKGSNKYMFSKFIEQCMTQGNWNGCVGYA